MMTIDTDYYYYYYLRSISPNWVIHSHIPLIMIIQDYCFSLSLSPIVYVCHVFPSSMVFTVVVALGFQPIQPKKGVRIDTYNSDSANMTFKNSLIPVVRCSTTNALCDRKFPHTLGGNAGNLMLPK
jgi:hypothetical protein